MVDDIPVVEKKVKRSIEERGEQKRQKFLFPLCRTCVEKEIDKQFQNREENCWHTAKERALTCTWCTLELEKAVEEGYIILYIYKVWHNQLNSLKLT